MSATTTRNNSRKGVIAAIAAIVLALVITTGANGLIRPFEASADGGQAPVMGTPVVSQPSSGWHFYNLEMLGTEEPFNFGPSPVHEGWTATDYINDLQSRMSVDPALGAAVLAWVDANVGTRYLGEFYETAQHNWAAAMNAAKGRWTSDPNEYFRTLDAFWAFVNASATASIDDTARQAVDQMYQNPFVSGDSPDIIVLETNQGDGPWLVLNFTIKGNQFPVEFRVKCGYQPSNVSRIMGITPQETPTVVPPASGNGGGGGTTPPGGTNPEPTPPVPTNPQKDPSKSSNTGRNDTDGPGPDTNNGVGSTESSADQPTNSGYMDSYQDGYKDAIDDLKGANDKAQQQGQSNNAPSSSPSSSSTVVDNNASSGTGYGGVDTSTPVAPETGATKGETAEPWSGLAG